MDETVLSFAVDGNETYMRRRLATIKCLNGTIDCMTDLPE